jgi:hypothetical protein
MKCFINRRTVFLGSLLMLHSEALFACPLCKDAISLGLARGFYWSILLMLGMPVLVVGVISGVVWRAFKKGSSGVRQD